MERHVFRTIIRKANRISTFKTIACPNVLRGHSKKMAIAVIDIHPIAQLCNFTGTLLASQTAADRPDLLRTYFT